MTDLEAAISYALTDDVLTRSRDAATDAGFAAMDADRDVEPAQFDAVRRVLVAAIVPVVERLIRDQTP